MVKILKQNYEFLEHAFSPQLHIGNFKNVMDEAQQK